MPKSDLLEAEIEKLAIALCHDTLGIVSPRQLRDTLADRLRKNCWLAPQRFLDTYLKVMNLRDEALSAQRIQRCMEAAAPPAPAVKQKPDIAPEARQQALQDSYDAVFAEAVDSRVSGAGVR
jgi:hypothetical protein